MSKPDYSYAADGRRVCLEPDPDWLLLDRARLGPAEWTRLARSPSGPAAVPLGEDRWAVRAASIESSLRRRLEAGGALSPLFRYAGQLVAVLPAVRAELREGASPPTVAARHPDCHWRPWRESGVELRPRSGNVEDTLATARALAGEADVLAATPRLLRLDRRRLQAGQRPLSRRL